MSTGTITLTLTIGDDGVPRTSFDSDIRDVLPDYLGHLYAAMSGAVIVALKSTAADFVRRGRPDQAIRFAEGFRSHPPDAGETTRDVHFVVERT